MSRDANHRVAADKGEASGKAGQKAWCREMAAPKIDPTELTSGGLQQIQPPVVQSGRMRHQHGITNCIASRYIDQDATIPAMVTPAVSNVAGADGGKLGRPAIPNCKAI